MGNLEIWANVLSGDVPAKCQTCGNLQHLSQHVTFDQWAHQGTGLMFIIHPLSQEPINPVGYGFLIKFNMLMPLVQIEFFVMIWNYKF